MKKVMNVIVTMVVLIICLIGINLNASVDLSYRIEMGYLPNNWFEIYSEGVWNEPEAANFYGEFESYLHLEGFYFGGGIKAYHTDDPFRSSFDPRKVDYKLQFGYENDKLDFGCRYGITNILGLGSTGTDWDGNFEYNTIELFVNFSGRTTF